MKKLISTLSLLATTPPFAEKSRQIDAHEHGFGVINIAVVNRAGFAGGSNS